MDRIPDRRYSEIIGEGLARLPEGMRRRIAHVRFVCGVDPVFAGLHSWATTTDGRAYRDVAHHVQPFNVLGPRDRRTDVIVIPNLRDVHPHIVVHELGHVLDLAIGCVHPAHPVTDYAGTDRGEAFAEALVAWTHWYGDRDVAMRDGATRSLFRELAA